jgi:hypothetical protein
MKDGVVQTGLPIGFAHSFFPPASGKLLEIVTAAIQFSRCVGAGYPSTIVPEDPRKSIGPAQKFFFCIDRMKIRVIIRNVIDEKRELLHLILYSRRKRQKRYLDKKIFFTGSEPPG